MVWGRVAYGPNGAPLRVPRPPLEGGEGGSPGPARGVKGRRPLGPPSASRGLKGGGSGERGGGVAPWFLAAPVRSPGPVPWRLLGVGLKVLAQARPHCRQGGAARPPLPLARPGLFGIPGHQARPGWPPAGQSGGGGGGSVCLPPVAAGGWLDGVGPGPPCGRWLRGVSRWREGEGEGEGDGGLGPDSGGGRPVGGYPRPLARTPLLSPFGPPGVGSLCWPSPTTPPPLSAPLPRPVAPAGGGGGGAAGAGGGSPGQRLVVSGLRVSGAPVRASLAPAVSPTGGGTCLPVVRTAGGLGGRSGSRGPGLSEGGPAPLVRSHPPMSVAWGPGPGLRGAGLLPPSVAVTCAAACVGAEAAAVVGSSGGSASG